MFYIILFIFKFVCLTDNVKNMKILMVHDLAQFSLFLNFPGMSYIWSWGVQHINNVKKYYNIITL